MEEKKTCHKEEGFKAQGELGWVAQEKMGRSEG
jgi:hypothetical protein